MKLCYVANSRFPSERAHMTQIVQMCNAFVENGHEVTLLVTDRKTNIVEDPESFFGVKFLFNIKRIVVPDIAGRSPNIPPFLRPSTFLIQRCVFAYRSARYINSERFDLIYGRDEWILWFVTYLVRISVVWESHEAKFSYIARSLIEKTKKLIVISEGIRDFYIEAGVPPSKILVAHDAVDNRFFETHVSKVEARRNLGIESKKPVIMYIGGLDVWKGAETLFEASKGQNKFEVYVVGGKDQEISILKTKYPEVHFLGPRPYRELPQCQQAADILVIPNTALSSLSSEYTSPLKLFAHLTSKKPIIASKIPSITNVLSNEEVYFFTADNPDSLLETIMVALNDPSASEVKAVNAYRKSFTYTWNNRANEIIKFL